MYFYIKYTCINNIYIIFIYFLIELAIFSKFFISYKIKNTKILDEYNNPVFYIL